MVVTRFVSFVAELIEVTLVRFLVEARPNVNVGLQPRFHVSKNLRRVPHSVRHWGLFYPNAFDDMAVCGTDARHYAASHIRLMSQTTT